MVLIVFYQILQMETEGYIKGKHTVERKQSLYVHSVSLSYPAVSFIICTVRVSLFVLFLIQNITNF